MAIYRNYTHPGQVEDFWELMMLINQDPEKEAVITYLPDATEELAVKIAELVVREYYGVEFKIGCGEIEIINRAKL